MTLLEERVQLAEKAIEDLYREVDLGNLKMCKLSTQHIDMLKELLIKLDYADYLID